MPKKEKTLADKTKDKLAPLIELIREVKGHRDVKTRLQVLTDPDNLNTMSVLTSEEAHFLSVSDWLVERPIWGLMFTGLSDYAKSIREPAISISGRGREDSIRLMGAISESKFLSKLGLNLKGGEKEK